jgi:hypothetical protein
MRADCHRLEELRRSLQAADKLVAIVLHVIDDRVQQHLALTLLEPELVRTCALANRVVIDIQGDAPEPRSA